MSARAMVYRGWYMPPAVRDLTLTSALLTVLLAAQGFHSVEHVVQVLQFHVLRLPASASTGLISAANAEWIHFVWNWSVVAVLVVLVHGGMRNVWAVFLVAWSI